MKLETGVFLSKFIIGLLPIVQQLTMINSIGSDYVNSIIVHPALEALYGIDLTEK